MARRQSFDIDHDSDDLGLEAHARANAPTSQSESALWLQLRLIAPRVDATLLVAGEERVCHASSMPVKILPATGSVHMLVGGGP